MRCVKCNRELTEGSRFCEYCGAPQPSSPMPNRVFCTNCGKEIPVGSRFCASCGTPVQGMGGGAGRGLPEPPKPEKDKGKTVLIVEIAAVAGLTIALIIAIVFLVGSRKKGSWEAEERESRYEEEERDRAEEEEEEEEEAPDEALEEDDTPAEDEIPAEQPPEEKENMTVTVTGDESSLAVTTDAGETLVEFTIPSELPIYDEMNASEHYSMMVHAVVDTGVSGRTIVEPYFGDTEETACEEYVDFYASNTGIGDPATAETFTREIGGREVLVYKRQEQTVNDFKKEVCSFSYLFAVPVRENLVLGFRCTGSYGVGKDVIFDDSPVDVLLSHCTAKVPEGQIK